MVESVIQDLLEDILTLVPEVGHEAYAKALEKAKQSPRAADKIEHVKDLIPDILRPGGANPLALLFAGTSEGLHALSDEDCLERAATIRGALIFLVHQVRESRDSATRFKKDLETLISKNSPEADD